MPSIVLDILSGQLVSSLGYFAPSGNYALAVQVPSVNQATRFRVEFAPSSDSAAGAFGPCGRHDGSGAFFDVLSLNPAGPAWGLVPFPATPWIRMAVSTSTAPMSFTILPVIRS